MSAPDSEPLIAGTTGKRRLAFLFSGRGVSSGLSLLQHPTVSLVPVTNGCIAYLESPPDSKACASAFRYSLTLVVMRDSFSFSGKGTLRDEGDPSLPSTILLKASFRGFRDNFKTRRLSRKPREKGRCSRLLSITENTRSAFMLTISSGSLFNLLRLRSRIWTFCNRHI